MNPDPKATNSQPNQKLHDAAMTFAKAWAGWHSHGSMIPDPELVDAGHGILEALGLEMVGKQGYEQKLVRKK